MKKIIGILIAYFTWADNTRVENPDSIDVDATTSASVLAPGNTAKLAAWIQEEAYRFVPMVREDLPPVFRTLEMHCQRIAQCCRNLELIGLRSIRQDRIYQNG